MAEEAQELISVIIPVYKAEKYLDRCLESVVNQTYKNLEIILVDDGSPDRCPQICNEWGKRDKRIRIVHKENGGLSSARNAGLAVAHGEYIGFVDSDDWIAPDMYEYLFGILKKSRADYASIEMKITRKFENTSSQPKVTEQLLKKDELFKLFFRVSSLDLHYCVCDKLYKRDLIKDLRFCEGQYFEDIDFNFEAIQKAEIAIYSNQIKYYWFENIGSITRNGIKPQDLQLIEIWGSIVQKCTHMEPDYLYYAKMNYERSYLGVLGKSIKYGVSKEFKDWNLVQDELLENLRRYKKDLLKWRMPVQRKLLMLCICINANLLRRVFLFLSETKALRGKND